MSSVAYWYQTEPHKPWPALPPGREQLPFRETNLVVAWKTVPQAKHSERPARRTGSPGATDNKQLFFQPTEEKAWLEMPFRVQQESIGTLRLRACHARDYGIYRVLLDGKEIGRADFYSPELRFGDEKLGWQELSPGDHTLRFECVGKNAASSGHLLGIDALLMQSPVYAHSTKTDLRTLQKKTE